MPNRQIVLVAIDHATDIRRAIDVARNVAETRSADVEVVQVVPKGAYVDDRSRQWSVESFDNGGEGMEAQLAPLLRPTNHEGVHVRRVTLRGAPGHVIPAYSQLRGATLLVVQRDYGSSLWRSGGVVNHLARQSPVPVLILSRRATPERDKHGLSRILTPVDFSIASAVALKTAVDLSRRHGARVTLVHALTEVPRQMVFSGSQAWGVVRRVPAELEGAANRLRRKAAMFGVRDVDTAVATGDADRAILEAASRVDPDLIVMGISRRAWLDRVLFGSTLRRVLRRATVPVLVIPVIGGAQAWLNEQETSIRWSDRARPVESPIAAPSTLDLRAKPGHRSGGVDAGLSMVPPAASRFRSSSTVPFHSGISATYEARAMT
jgi:nucleotide-binding universal stress UspA family protein